MVQRKPTPEEQLLKLIENPELAKPGAAAPKKAGAVPRIPGSGAWKGFYERFRGNLGRAKDPAGVFAAAELFTIRNANRILATLVGAGILYLGTDLIFLRDSQADFLAHVGVSEPVYPTPEKGAGEAVDIGIYEETFAKRNPFLPPQTLVTPVAETQDPSAASESSGTPMSEALQSIKLVGVSWGTEPLAMIEDVATGRTYFLRKGQEIKGLKVQQVGKEKVVVTYEGQEAELY